MEFLNKPSINPRKTSIMVRLNLLKKLIWNKIKKTLDTLFKLEMDRMKLDRRRQKLQEALVAAIVVLRRRGRN
jgi:hypothetical protein